MRNINYYSVDSRLKEISFDLVFDQWIQSIGGKENVARNYGKLTAHELYAFPTTFLMFFMEKYKAQLPEYDDPFYQEYLFEHQLYQQKFNSIIYDHNTRVTSPYNIVVLIILALAVIGLISMCN